MARWTIDKQPFNCTVKYFAGKKNIVADCISRLRSEPNFLDTLNKLPKITCINGEVECHVTTRLQSKVNNTEVDKFLDHSSSSDDESVQFNKITKKKIHPSSNMFHHRKKSLGV